VQEAKMQDTFGTHLGTGVMKEARVRLGSAAIDLSCLLCQPLAKGRRSLASQRIRPSPSWLSHLCASTLPAPSGAWAMVRDLLEVKTKAHTLAGILCNIKDMEEGVKGSENSNSKITWCGAVSLSLFPLASPSDPMPYLVRLDLGDGIPHVADKTLKPLTSG
jgi:hypothetical protein